MAGPDFLEMPIPPRGGLSVELVPKTAWLSNVRTLVTRAEWEMCKRFVRERSGDRCEICGGQGRRWPVECHETWLYDDETFTQKLTGLIALCPNCHQVKHLGFAEARGNLEAALHHLQVVNRWTRAQAMLYANAVFVVWRGRSEYQWTLDISYLETLGIDVQDIIDNNLSDIESRSIK